MARRRIASASRGRVVVVISIGSSIPAELGLDEQLPRAQVSIEPDRAIPVAIRLHGRRREVAASREHHPGHARGEKATGSGVALKMLAVVRKHGLAVLD